MEQVGTKGGWTVDQVGIAVLSCISRLSGARTAYGLSAEVENLPALFLLGSGRGTSGGSSNWMNGVSESSCHGAVFRNTGEPILHLESPECIGDRSQRARLDAIRKLNPRRNLATVDAEIAQRIQSYEPASRMQASAPDLLCSSGDSQATLNMYGVGA